MNKLVRTGVQFVKDNAPVILTGISIASTVGATILSAKSTPRAIEILRDAEDEKGAPLTPVEKIQTVAPVYAPAAALTLLSCASSIGAAVMGETRNAELLGMVCTSERLIEKYSAKLSDKFGPEEAKVIKKEVIQEAAPKLIPGDVGVYETGEGQELIFDSWSGRAFRSSEEALRLHYAQFMENLSFDPDTFWPINDFYGLAYLPETGAGRRCGYSSTYKPGDLNLMWDSDRQIYKIMYFDNEPLPEIKTT